MLFLFQSFGTLLHIFLRQHLMQPLFQVLNYIVLLLLLHGVLRLKPILLDKGHAGIIDPVILGFIHVWDEREVRVAGDLEPMIFPILDC